MRRCLILCMLACATAGCGHERASPAAQRAVATDFARAVVAGRAQPALRLIAHGADPVVGQQVARLTAPFTAHRGSLRSRGKRSGDAQWAFPYRRRVNGRHGAFTRETGWLVVDTSDSAPPRVKFAAILARNVTYSTHHDAQLLPSKR
ncbi:MAG: hypothetical protein ACXVRJ_11850 [Gaiellaceae bacterium]